MSRRVRYRYYDAPQHSGVLPLHLKQLLRSECALGQSLDSLVRWRVDLCGIREGLVVQWDGAQRSIAYEEIRQEEEECAALEINLREALKSVQCALTTAVCMRRS